MAFLIAGHAVQAQEWEAIGPYNGRVSALTVNSDAPATLYAAMVNSAIYKTENATAVQTPDEGVLWEDLPVFYSCYHVSHIIVKQHNLFVFEGGT